MASINKVLIIGNLGRDPEMRFMPNGDAVCNLAVATSETWKDKQTGEKKEQTEWHRAVMYRKLAEVAGQYLKKGSTVYLEGKLQTRKWTDKEGVERFTTEIVADEMKMLGGGPQRSDDSAQEAQHRQQKPAPQNKREEHYKVPQTQGGPGDMDDDIPF